MSIGTKLAVFLYHSQVLSGAGHRQKLRKSIGILETFGGKAMWQRNNGQAEDDLQFRFTAYLVSAVKRRRKDYLIQFYKRSSIESTVEVSMSLNPAQRKWSWTDYRLWMSLRMERFWRRCRNSMNGNARYFWLERWRKKISRLWEQSLGCPTKGWLHFTTGRSRKSERALKEVTRDEF